MTSDSVSIPAYAKINWSLRVLGKRDDGYHEIDTVMQTISLHDTITVAQTDDPTIGVWCDDGSIPCDETNLVWRAAAAVRERYSINRGVKIRLEKRIPSEAGLGGGSSDAAATLIALAQLWDIQPTADDVISIGKSLGSDVPFFFCGGTARATGRGEQIVRVGDVPEQHLLVIKPSANIPTAHAYNSLNSRALTSSNAKPILVRSQASHDSDSLDLNALHNDFEATVFKFEPEIARAKNALLKSGASAAILCGSGSAVFGIFENQDAQERAIQAIELETGWRAFPCKTVGRSEYRDAVGKSAHLAAVGSDVQAGSLRSRNAGA
jgi:4-diphosphocytidyl-2-C-methyl-D-erythritol kinase